MHRKRIAFVINPNSGANRSKDRVAYLKSLLSDQYEGVIFEWKRVEDRDAIFKQVMDGNFDIAVAVGGDGTVNQLAHTLCGSNTALGILPFGSGNGLARHLGIPMDIPAAMRLLEKGKITTIDRGRINGHSFFCTSGSGFDAHIGKLFAESTTRGLSTYAGMVIREFSNYKPQPYHIDIDGEQFKHDAFLITIANAGQYGNNAWIAPEANIRDGKLHLVVIQSVRWWNLPGIVIRLFGKRIHHSRFVKTYSGKRIRISRTNAGPIHFDGEPLSLPAKLEVEVEQSALRVVVPESFN